MTNNDILRRIRYAFDFKDEKMIEIFAKGNLVVSRPQVSNWMKKDDDELFCELVDKDLAAFLNGIIVEKRGKKDGTQPVNEDKLTNNIILRKLKIAFNYIDEDLIEVMVVGGSRVSKHELSAFFRKPTHAKYKELQNQILRNFLKGLQLKYREDSPYKF